MAKIKIKQSLFFAFFYNALGVPLGRRGPVPILWHAAEPDGRRGGHELQFGVGDRERAAVARCADMTALIVRLRPDFRLDSPSWMTPTSPGSIEVGPRLALSRRHTAWRRSEVASCPQSVLAASPEQP